MSSEAALARIVEQHGLRPEFPPDVRAEVQAWLASPGIDDPALVDRTALPFVTVDGPDTRDLDQALHVARLRDGWRVSYAVADAAWFVRPGSALFDEALARGASYYLPGLVVPMLPRELSEGIISLNPAVPRRALVMQMTLDSRGDCTGTEIVRARIRSRAKLAFGQVQALLDRTSHELRNSEYAESLRGLAEVGAVRLARAEERGVVRHRRSEVEVKLGPHWRFVATRELDGDVERYNEQLSLLANEQGARLLAAADRDDDHVQPIYRVHPAPAPERIRELAARVRELALRHGLSPDVWSWNRDTETLSSYLGRLPHTGPGRRVALAVHQLALWVNGRSAFSAEPGSHFGVGAELYARFTAPMREIVGVFCHKEAWEKLAGRGPAGDEPLRDAVIDAANRAKELQKRLTKAANLLVLDQLFSERRGKLSGTVVGVAKNKLYVVLDDPPVEVKVYVRHLERQLGQRPTLDDAEMELATGDGWRVRLGDALSLSVRGREGESWVLAVERP